MKMKLILVQNEFFSIFDPTSDSACNPYKISTYISVQHIDIEDFLLINYFNISAFVSLL